MSAIFAIVSLTDISLSSQGSSDLRASVASGFSSKSPNTEAILNQLLLFLSPYDAISASVENKSIARPKGPAAFCPICSGIGTTSLIGSVVPYLSIWVNSSAFKSASKVGVASSLKSLLLFLSFASIKSCCLL